MATLAAVPCGEDPAFPAGKVCPRRRSSRHERPRRGQLRSTTCGHTEKSRRWCPQASRPAPALPPLRPTHSPSCCRPHGQPPQTLTFCPCRKGLGSKRCLQRESTSHCLVAPRPHGLRAAPRPALPTFAPEGPELRGQPPPSPWQSRASALPWAGPPAPRGHAGGQERKLLRRAHVVGRVQLLLAERISCSVDFCLDLSHFLPLSDIDTSKWSCLGSRMPPASQPPVQPFPASQQNTGEDSQSPTGMDKRLIFKTK